MRMKEIFTAKSIEEAKHLAVEKFGVSEDQIVFRILEEPLMITGIGVAFAKEDDRGICEQMEQTLEEMRQDGTSLKIIEKYLDDPQKYLEVDDLGY